LKFNTGKELIKLCNDLEHSIYEVMILRECELSGKSKHEIINEMHSSYDIMKQAVKSGVTKDIISISGLTGGDAKKIFENSASIHGPVCGVRVNSWSCLWSFYEKSNGLLYGGFRS